MNTDLQPQTATRVKTAVIIASVREGRFAPVVAGWFTRHATQRDDVEIDVIDLAEGTQGLSARLADAESFIVITPEYNHSFPGPLKSVIDDHRDEWFAKPVAFVSYGGVSGGLRAVEHLRTVFAELHATTVRDTVSFHGAWERFDQLGEPIDGKAVTAATDTMLDHLVWWARALSAARHDNPFAA
ncbi:NADPH-dependent FMN reductase [Aeromicrobium sp.]|uniref:NADPH-dependent FMN reductase n=1 Tax=Aeromicrobium sp. TaxID=1871063 RepID=UPI002FCBCE62